MALTLRIGRAIWMTWALGLDGIFLRSAPRRRVVTPLRGLMAPLERKNGWQLAEAAGDRTPDGMQEFLSRARWDADLVRDDLRRYAIEHLGDDQAVLVLDETGFQKKGTKSVGVQRQYSGTAGRIENSQIGVFPKLGQPSWPYPDRPGALSAGELDRESGALRRGWRAALGQLRDQARAWPHHAFACFCGRGAVRRGDGVYGGGHRRRRLIEAHGRGYVLAVRNNQGFGQAQATDWVDRLTEQDWHRHRAGDGAQGPRLCDWALVPAEDPTAEGWQKHRLIRRASADPTEVAFYLTQAPTTTALADLVQVAGRRWTIEACFEAAKGEVGLDHHEVRSWSGWPHEQGWGDITLAMLAHACLTVLRKAAAGRSDRSASRAVTSDRARTAPPSLATGLGPTTRPKRHHRLVDLATVPPATRKEMAPENP